MKCHRTSDHPSPTPNINSRTAACRSYRRFPEYHPKFYATFFLDQHGFMLEAVTYEDPDA